MNENPLKLLWIEYTKFKNWAHTTNPKMFTVESCSLDEDEMTSSSTMNNDTTTSAIEDQFIAIIGLIYPSTEPFREKALRIEIRLPMVYPQKGPVVYMKTNIRHPNIDENGRIWCIFLEQETFWAFVSLSGVVFQVTQLIDQPEQRYVVNAEMGSLYATNFNEYNQKMKEMVAHHGIPRCEDYINIDQAQYEASRLAARSHFICQFDGCNSRCNGNHGLLVTLCPMVHRFRATCEKCGRVSQSDDRPFDFRCKQCNHVYCYMCSFHKRS